MSIVEEHRADQLGLLDGVSMFQQIRFYLYETDFEGEYYNYDKKKFRFYSYGFYINHNEENLNLANRRHGSIFGLRGGWNSLHIN